MDNASEEPGYAEDESGTSGQTMSAVGWLLLYSTAMFTLPFAAFYSTRHALTHYLHIDGFPNTCGSVVAAVLVVNIIILLYALRGYEEAKDEDDNDDNHRPMDGSVDVDKKREKKSKKESKKAK